MRSWDPCSALRDSGQVDHRHFQPVGYLVTVRSVMSYAQRQTGDEQESLGDMSDGRRPIPSRRFSSLQRMAHPEQS